jgi:hypothetical protein
MNDNGCPLRCRGVTFMKISVPFKHQMDNLFKIKCKNERNGCDNISLYGDLEMHEKSC